MRILGISAFYHDSAAALIEDGRIVAAAQEERFTRKKHDAAFPVEAIRYCLDKADTDLDGVDHVVFFEKPLVKFERLVETYLGNVPSGFQSFRMAMPLWIKDKLFQKSGLLKSLKPFSATGEMDGKKLLFAAHHQSHAASAFFPSPFDEAVVLAMDGVGEWTTTSVSIGRGNTLELKREIKFPHSLGLLYSAFTYYTGFKVNSGEYKVMGLAPYGEPKYYDLIMKHIVRRQAGRLLLARPQLFQLYDRPDDDVGKVPRAFRRSAARIREPGHPARDGSRRLHTEGDRGNHAAHDARAGENLWHPQSVHGGRRRAQLRRERQDPARRPFRPHLDSTCGGRCRRRARSGACGALPASGQSPPVERRARLHAGLLSRPGIRARGYRAASHRERRAL